MDEEYTKEDLTRSTEGSESKPEPEIQKIYCGPNIPSKGLFTYQVFLGGFSYAVKQLMQEIPEIEKLMVDVKNVDDVRMRINQKGSLENLYYERIKGKVKK